MVFKVLFNPQHSMRRVPARMQQRPHPALKEGWWPFIIPVPWTSPSHGSPGEG